MSAGVTFIPSHMKPVRRGPLVEVPLQDLRDNLDRIENCLIGFLVDRRHLSIDIIRGLIERD